MTRSPRLLALGIAFLAAQAASAAEIPKPPANASAARNTVAKLRSGLSGLRVGDDPKFGEDVKTVARWLAYMIATPPLNGEPVPRDDKTASIYRTMGDLMGEAESLCTIPPVPTNMGKLSVEQIEFGAAFGKAIAQEAKFVWSNSARPIERINAVRLMSIAARMPAPDLADPLVEVISNDKVSDGEKVYAFQGLRALLEQSDLIDPSKHVVRDVVKLGQIAQALSNYITRKRDPRDDRERAVIEFVRRHAVAALAQFKDGVLRKPNKDVVYRPAWTLMRVLGGDPAVTPGFSTLEKVEATIGLCQARPDAEMNLDVAAYMVAVAPVPGANTTLLGGLVEFARAANEDYARASAGGEGKDKEKNLPAAHWRVLAARQSYALSVWRETAKGLPAGRNPAAVIGIANEGIQLLGRIEKDGFGAGTGADVAKVTDWATNNPPKAWRESPPQSALLFRDDPQSVVPFAAKATNTLKTDPKKGPDPKPVSPMPPAKGPDPKAAPVAPAKKP